MWKDHIFRKALGPVLQQINAEYEASEGEVFPPGTLHDLLFNFSLNCLSLLQQQDGPRPEHDDLSFSYLLVAPVVLFCKNAPLMSKIILNHQPDSSKSASKRKRVPQAAAPPSPGQGEEGYYQEGLEMGRTIFLGSRGFEHYPGLDSLFEFFFLSDVILLNCPAFFAGRY
jgi:hypothetical protein